MPDLILDKIAAARRDQSEALDLSNCGLTSLSAALKRYVDENHLVPFHPNNAW